MWGSWIAYDQPVKGYALKVPAVERIELIYRPDNLAGESVDAVAKLHWQFVIEKWFAPTGGD